MIFNPASWPNTCFHKVYTYDFPFVIKQDVSVLEQEKIDKLMLDMDGTDNKCKLHSQMCTSVINVDCENGKVQTFYIERGMCVVVQLNKVYV